MYWQDAMVSDLQPSLAAVAVEQLPRNLLAANDHDVLGSY
jgi:hypothetical protein